MVGIVDLYVLRRRFIFLVSEICGWCKARLLSTRIVRNGTAGKWRVQELGATYKSSVAGRNEF